MLAPEAYLENLSADVEALAEAAAAADLDLEVPACPGWSLYDLIAHTGSVHRWATETVHRRSKERISRRGLPPPPGPGQVVDWFREGGRSLVDELRRTGPDAEVWNWARPVQPSLFWFRRQALETALHRWDAQSAAGRPSAIDTELALDGIEELLSLVVPGAWPEGEDLLGGSIHIHATDGPGEWTVSGAAGRPEVTRGHAKGDAAVRGPASDLLLFLWGRPLPAGAVETFGSPSVPEAWRSALRF